MTDIEIIQAATYAEYKRFSGLSESAAIEKAFEFIFCRLQEWKYYARQSIRPHTFRVEWLQVLFQDNMPVKNEILTETALYLKQKGYVQTDAEKVPDSFKAAMSDYCEGIKEKAASFKQLQDMDIDCIDQTAYKAISDMMQLASVDIFGDIKSYILLGYEAGKAAARA